MGWNWIPCVGSPRERQTFVLPSALGNPKVISLYQDNPLSRFAQVSVHLGGEFIRRLSREKNPNDASRDIELTLRICEGPVPKSPHQRQACKQIDGARRPHSLRGSQGSLLTSPQALSLASPTLNSPRHLQWSIAAGWSTSKDNCRAIKLYFY